MKRQHFLIVAAMCPWLFGSVMMFFPDVMLTNNLSIAVETTTRVVTQWVGFSVFSLGWITFLSCTDSMP